VFLVGHPTGVLANAASRAPVPDGLLEVRHATGGEDPPGGGGATEPGVVVDHVQHIDLGTVGEAVVGEVGLPALVGTSAQKR
jgi:hypothetical protein